MTYSAAQRRAIVYAAIESGEELDTAITALLGERLAVIAAQVRALPIDYHGSDMSWDKYGVLRVNTVPARKMVDLDAVLAMLEE